MRHAPSTTILLACDDQVFAASHFLVLPTSPPTVEPLHVHDWRVTLAITGELDPEVGWVLDFVESHKKLLEVLAPLQNRLLLPKQNDALRFSSNEETGQTEIYFSDQKWVRPTSECLFLPITQVSTELLAWELHVRLMAALNLDAQFAIELTLEEAPGMSAVVRG